MDKQKTILNEIVIIRPILIVLLVFYHAFAPYSGGWKPIANVPDIQAYWWLDKLSYAFMLEMFVFVSGYVFGFQVRTKGEYKLKAQSVLWGKFKRLIIPSIVFSIIYVVCFRNRSASSNVSLLYDILAGAGHLWFLPMLFWCFVSIWCIEKLKISPKLVFPVLLLCAILPQPPIPFQASHTLYYMLFFYVGYQIQRHPVKLEKMFTAKVIVLSGVLFAVLFPSLTLAQEQVIQFGIGGGKNELYEKSLRL